MPQKTIYIRDEDMKIFEEAEELAKKEQYSLPDLQRKNVITCEGKK